MIMTLQELIQEKPSKINVQQAAAIMGVTPMFLRMALRLGKFPFGVAVKGNTERFINYMIALDMK